MPGPAAAAPVLEMEPSPALRIFDKMKDTLYGTRNRHLVADGSDGAVIEKMKMVATDSGTVVKIVAPKLGLSDGSLLTADDQLAGTPSMLFDAVAVCSDAANRLGARCFWPSHSYRRR